MPAKFQTKITKARFVYSPLSGQRMAEIGQSLIETIFARWDRGMDVNDRPAPPLVDNRRRYYDDVFGNSKQLALSGLVGITKFNRYGADRGYRGFKQRKTGSVIRDLKLSGRLRRSIKVLNANENKITMGPTDGMHTRLKGGGQLSFSDVLTLNQRRWRMWGISPAEKAKLVRLFAGERPVKATVARAA